MIFRRPLTGNSDLFWGLPILQSLLLVVLACTLSIAFRPDDALVHRPIVEDGYYAFTVARNIALGRGITIDGVHLTNGFQPLFTFMSSIPYRFFPSDRVEPIRWVLILHWIFHFAALYLVGLIGRDLIPPAKKKSRLASRWISMVLYASSVLVFVVSFNGLETGCVLFLYALAWRFSQTREINTISDHLILGTILGFLLLARVDGAFILLTVCCYLLFRNSAKSISMRLFHSCVVGLSAVLISSPWWLFNKSQFGSFMPTSGNAYRSLIGPTAMFKSENVSRILDGLHAFFRVLVPNIYLGQNTFENVWISIVRIILCGGIILFLWQQRGTLFSFPRAAKDDSGRGVRFGMILGASQLLLAVSYIFTFSATWFYTRYFSPLILLGVLGLALIFVQWIEHGRTAVHLVILILCVPLLWVTFSLHSGKFQSEFINDQIGLVSAHVPDAEWVASFQTGTLGYFRDNVLNLDGKVNPEAIANKNDILGYVQRNDIHWLCDYTFSIDLIMGKDALRQNGWSVVASQGNFSLYRRMK